MFLENRRSWENHTKKQRIARKVDFLSPAFYNAPSLRTAYFRCNFRPFRAKFHLDFDFAVGAKIVYFLSSLRARTAKTLICTKSGVSADSRKSAKKCGKPHFFVQKVRKKCGFLHCLALLLESVWALRLDRKYTKLKHSRGKLRHFVELPLPWGSWFWAEPCGSLEGHELPRGKGPKTLKRKVQTTTIKSTNTNL